MHVLTFVCTYMLHRGLRALWDYMKSELGVDTDAVWEQIKDLAIKTIIRQVSVCIWTMVFSCFPCIHTVHMYVQSSVLARPNLQGGPPFLNLEFDFICNDLSFPETGKQFVPLYQLFR